MVMATAVAVRGRRRLSQRGVGMPGDNSRIIEIARSLRDRVDAPVLGGIAVYLHGWPRATVDLDLYASDRKAIAEQLEAAGAKWSRSRREHVLDGVPIHTVTPEEAGHVVERTSIIDGVRVVSLKDLIAIKLRCGLKNPGRAKDIADVQELVRAIPLDKRFAGKLPKELRASFKSMVDAVRSSAGPPRETRF